MQNIAFEILMFIFAIVVIAAVAYFVKNDWGDTDWVILGICFVVGCVGLLGAGIFGRQLILRALSTTVNIEDEVLSWNETVTPVTTNVDAGNGISIPITTEVHVSYFRTREHGTCSTAASLPASPGDIVSLHTQYFRDRMIACDVEAVRTPR